MPTHYVHHKFNMWHYNFGMALDIWDRVFRTYKPVPQWREGIDPANGQTKFPRRPLVVAAKKGDWL